MGLQKLPMGAGRALMQAAVAVIRVESAEFHYLVLRRAQSPLDPWSGHFALPGGRREPHDPDLLAACRRETLEECGIDLSLHSPRRVLPPALAGGAIGRPLEVAPFLFELPDFPHVTLDAAECAAYHWVPESHLRDPGRHASIAPLPDATRRFPAIELGDGHIWGFTYKVLMDVLGVIDGG